MSTPNALAEALRRCCQAMEELAAVPHAPMRQPWSVVERAARLLGLSDDIIVSLREMYRGEEPPPA